ncbi:MAG: methionyl-tRNA formyltransferase [Parcubacteria group bacterium]|nr:methionyl-tRNA formyltransferase [Parcubacteria group bacterium]
METHRIKFAFFGTPQFAVGVLGELEKHGFLPSLVVTAPDKPRGRKLVITPPEVKVWSQKRNIPVLQQGKLDISKFKIQNSKFDVFVVVAYGKILPKAILALPKYGVLNVHPSLLPRLRGASPIQSAILGEDKTGVTIMLLDEEMDHGPIVAQKEYAFDELPPKASVLEKDLAKLGGEMLAETLPKYVAGETKPTPQDHHAATYTKKIQKEDGLLDLSDDPIKNIRKIKAFDVWPRAYFFHEASGKKIRVIVTDAKLHNGKLLITKVLPEGKTEMMYEEFLRLQR